MKETIKKTTPLIKNEELLSINETETDKDIQNKNQSFKKTFFIESVFISYPS